MKTKLLYIVCILLTGFVQACTSEVDDLFDTPAQQRVNEEIKECRELLLSAELGWKMDYYPSGIQAYGGYAMTMKFSATNVTVASEITGDPAATETSLYSLKADRGPTLNFDTYNSILHYFSDPDSSEGAGNGKGYEGDYEFIIHSHSQDEIILKGKKTRNIIKMTRLTEPSETYLKSIIEMRDKLSSKFGILGYTGQINGEKVSLTMPSDRRFSIQIDESIVNMAYMYTPTGILFYQPVEIGGKEVSTLDWLETEQGFVSDGETLKPVIDPAYSKFEKYLGEYIMNYAYGTNDREVPITLVPLKYNATEKLYLVKGLPFPLQISYNETIDCMEILAYTASGYYVAVWELIGDGHLSWAAGLGMISQLREGTDTVFEFVDNGVWGTYIARAIILWSPGGEYKGFGGDTRFQNIVFTKK